VITTKDTRTVIVTWNDGLTDTYEGMTRVFEGVLHVYTAERVLHIPLTSIRYWE
jgi:hypothetical protein